MNKRYFLVLIPVFFFLQINAQEILTLPDAISLAKTVSTASKRAETRLENRYWQYRVFRSNYVPQLTLNGTLPEYVNTVREVVQDDGGLEYRGVNLLNTNLILSASQTIAATGGEIFINTSLYRSNNFLNNHINYGGDPVSIGFRQPLFSFNPLKWDKRIEPLRYEESKREYVEEYEAISAEATRRYFNLLLAQISMEIAELNVSNNDTVYKIAQGRYRLGKIPENDLLQLELNLMNSQQAVAQAKLDYETAQLSLRSYLGITSTTPLQLVLPEEIPLFEVTEKEALEMAKLNRREMIAFDRARLEADRDVARAVGETGLNASLFGRFGLTNNGNELTEIYQYPDDQQEVRLGFSIPIIDWGRQKSRVKTAQANQQLIQYTIQQEEIDFTQEVITQVKRFKVLRDQVMITMKADEISQRRYFVAKNRYLVGKISITDLSMALTEKDRAKQTYINSLSNLWQAYYNLRRLTLYDFVEEELLYLPDDN
jgi:outer membrane protein